MEYEITCLDECGHEMLAFVGTQAECQEKMKTIHEECPECRQFRTQRSVSEVAQEQALRAMTDEDFEYRMQMQERYDDEWG